MLKIWYISKAGEVHIKNFSRACNRCAHVIAAARSKIYYLHKNLNVSM